jgi:sugar lactone lactonase YvrE
VTLGKKIGIAILVVVPVAAAYLLLWPVPIDPAAWTPPAAPQTHDNGRLRGATRLAKQVHGPEATAVGPDGKLYAGTADGRVVRIDLERGTVEPFAVTEGRPLGMKFDGTGALIVADAVKGLLSIDGRGAVTVLANEHDGKPLRFVDDVAIGPGMIYFSDASTRFGYGQHILDAMEHRPNGRVFAFDPTKRMLKLLIAGLYFPNGVALSPDGAFLVVNETWKYRVLRHWLTGPRAGKTETWIDNLPGIPDNLNPAEGGGYWVALYTPRNAQLDSMLPRPFLRKLSLRLPAAFRPKPVHHAYVLKLDADGKIALDLQDGSPEAYAPITSVTEHAGKLYLGSLEAHGVGVVAVP